MKRQNVFEPDNITIQEKESLDGSLNAAVLVDANSSLT